MTFVLISHATSLYVSDARTGCYVVLCGEIRVTCVYEWGRETVESQLTLDIQDSKMPKGQGRHLNTLRLFCKLIELHFERTRFVESVHITSIMNETVCK